MMNEKAQKRIAVEKKAKTGNLSLINCDLKQIPEDVNKMPWLQVLFLENNQIAQIKNLDQLQQLQSLYLSN